MTKTYTIIDNFDKIKLAPYEEAEATSTTGFYMLPTLLFGDDIPKHRETIFEETSNLSFGAASPFEIPVKNYKTPFTFTADTAYEYMPDMYRYITGRRFYVDSLKKENPTYQLRYPSESTFAFPASYKQMEQSTVIWKQQQDGTWELTSPPPKSFSYYFDLPYAPETIDLNSKLFNNDITFEQYYKPAVITSKNAAIDTIYSLAEGLLKSAPKTLSEVLATLNEFKKSETFVDDLGLRNTALFLGSEPGKDPKKINLVSLHGATSPAYVISNSTEAQDLLKKLLFFKIGNEFIQPGSGKSYWDPLPSKHIYLTTDLVKGTGKPTEESDSVVNSDVVTINSEYKYFSQLAENFPENIVSELQLPNLYTYYNMKTKRISYYKDLTTLEQGKPIKIEDFSVQNYYNLIQDSTLESATPHRYKNIVVSNIKELEEASSIAKLFPMHNEITVPLRSGLKSEFMEILKKHGKADIGIFMTVLGNYFSSTGGALSSEHTFALANETAKISTTTLQIMDLSHFLNVFPASPAYLKYFDDMKNVKLAPSDLILDEESDQALATLGFAFVSQSKINDHLTNKRLGIPEIYKGDKCHSEILAYEIAKFKRKEDGTMGHVQSIFLPNSFEGDQKDASYLDTQVFYGQDYIYEVFTHSLVVGTAYNFEREGFGFKQDFSGGKEGWLLPKATSNVETKAVIVRAPFFNNDSLDAPGLFGWVNKQITTILDKPPLPPEITFHPYKDKKNKILILLNTNYGARELIPIKIFADEAEKIKKIKAAQEGTTKNPNAILYKTDDARGTYRIYKTSSKPTSWADFSTANVKALDSTKNTGYNDFIKENVDYYYMARQEDIHGNLSNPTDIFYIRIVKEEGFPPYLINKTYSFNENKKIETERSFRKYIKIGLTDGARKLVNAEQGINKVDVAYAKADSDDQLKKYKIRLTSKKTGKKIDINVDFAKTINTNYLDKNKNQANALNDLVNKGAPVQPSPTAGGSAQGAGAGFESMAGDAAKAANQKAEKKLSDPSADTDPKAAQELPSIKKLGAPVNLT
jgi:hypothetical protein